MSLSCTLSSKKSPIRFAPEFGALPSGCESSVLRIDSEGLVIEQWSVGEQRTIEVSLRASDTRAALKDFVTSVAARLGARGAQMIDRSKQEIGASCEARHATTEKDETGQR